jgi:hypothetical protein
MRKYTATNLLFSGNAIASIVILMFGGLTFSSCNKNNGPTDAIITVLDTIGKPVSAATVILWQDTSHSTQTGLQSSLRQSKSTDVNGKASFEFQQEAYLNIYAIKNSDTVTGIIQLKQYNTVSQTVQF